MIELALQWHDFCHHFQRRMMRMKLINIGSLCNEHIHHHTHSKLRFSHIAQLKLTLAPHMRPRHASTAQTEPHVNQTGKTLDIIVILHGLTPISFVVAQDVATCKGIANDGIVRRRATPSTLSVAKSGQRKRAVEECRRFVLQALGTVAGGRSQHRSPL